MAISRDLKAAVAAAWRKARSLARDLERAIAGPPLLEPHAVERSRDESVFQPRKH